MTNRLRAPLTALAIVAAGVLIFPAIGSAWNATGHRTVADIAWQHMTPTARARATELLMHGPPVADFASLRPTAGSDADRDRALFMNAATWPDMIRSADEPAHVYNRTSWHYADFYWDVESGLPHDISGTGPDSVNAGERIIAFRAALMDPSVADTTKALDLTWILHLVGDIHQPLHASSMVDAQDPLPRGDLGGNKFKLEGRNELHGFWDSILDETTPRDSAEDGVAYSVRLADGIERTNPLSALMTQAASTSVAEWEHEGLHLSQTVVYQGVTRGQAPSAAYTAEALKVSETQIALAGYRLAALLNAALK